MPTREQEREALTAAERKDPELYLFLRLEATTGLRPGEVCALWWQDVDLEAAELLVTYNVVHAKGASRTATCANGPRPVTATIVRSPSTIGP